MAWAAVAVAGLAATPAPGLARAAAPAALQRGQAFVEANCARCHAVGRKGDSPLAAAPRFRELSRRYPLEDLEEALSEGIVTGHKDMPQFALDRDQVRDVIAYLKSLAPRRAGPRR